MASAQARQERRWRRAAGAFTVALLLHGSALLVVSRLPPSPRPEDQPLIVELREVAPRVEPLVPPPVVPKQRVRQRSSARPLPARPAPEPAPAQEASAARHPSSESERMSPPSSEATPPVDLFAPEALERATGRWLQSGPRLPGGVDQAPGPAHDERLGEEGPAAERARVSGRLARDVADAKARNRVVAGLVDPWFYSLKKDLKSEWKPTPGMMGGKDGDDVFARVSQLVHSWRGAGRRYVESGSPYPEGELPGGLDQSRPDARAAGGTSGFDGPGFAARWNSGEFSLPDAIVIVRLTQDGSGRPLHLEILRSSGFAVFDESALRAVEAVAIDKVAPSHGLGLGGPRIESIWRLQAVTVAKTCSFVPDTTGLAGVSGGAGFVPSSIQCGGTFDESLGTAEVDTPGEPKVITRIDLIALHGGEEGPRVE